MNLIYTVVLNQYGKACNIKTEEKVKQYGPELCEVSDPSKLGEQINIVQWNIPWQQNLFKLTDLNYVGLTDAKKKHIQ